MCRRKNFDVGPVGFVGRIVRERKEAVERERKEAVEVYLDTQQAVIWLEN